MDAKLFDFDLPADRIAQSPVEPRDASKLLLCQAKGALGNFNGDFQMRDLVFRDVADLLGAGDFLVMNDAKVLPVRILGKRQEGDGAVEVLLLRRCADNEWMALLHMSARARPGLKFLFPPGLAAEVLSTHEERAANDGEVRLRFSGDVLRGEALESWLEKYGHVPLPPYIDRADAAEDRSRYQTVYARASGSAAAPTAGFHFTDDLLAKLDAKGIERASVTLHIGLGTFRPLKTENIDDHPMHEESFEISESFAEAFLKARANRKRIVAVGTTSVRALESWAVAARERGLRAGDAGTAGVFSTRLFIRPGFERGHEFLAVDDLITNFHLPRSTLIVLVAAAMGIDGQQKAYQHALEHGYRFFSYGDAMMVRGN